MAWYDSLFNKDPLKDGELMKAPEATFGGMGVANNLTAGGVEGIGGSVPMTPQAQMQSGSMAKSSPDWRGMAKDLGKGMTAMKAADKEIKNIGLMQQAQAPQMPMGVAGNQTMGQPQGVSSAMQAIMQNMPEQQRKMGIMGLLGR